MNFHPPRCCPWYSFKVAFVLFDVGTIRLDGVFEMRSRQRALKRDKDLLRQACKGPLYEVQYSPNFNTL